SSAVTTSTTRPSAAKNRGALRTNGPIWYAEAIELTAYESNRGTGDLKAPKRRLADVSARLGATAYAVRAGSNCSRPEVGEVGVPEDERWNEEATGTTAEATGRVFDDRDPTPDDPEDKEDRGRAYFADGITVYFNARKCWHTGICLRGLPLVFEVGRRPWVRADLDAPERIAAQIDLCPSKALTYDLIANAAEPGTA